MARRLGATEREALEGRREQLEHELRRISAQLRSDEALALQERAPDSEPARARRRAGGWRVWAAEQLSELTRSTIH